MFEETKRKVKYYRVEPVYKEPFWYEGSIMTAALVTCMATGETLDGMGGGGDFISIDIYHALRNNGTPKVIIDEAEYETLKRKAGL